MNTVKYTTLDKCTHWLTKLTINN